MGRKKKSSKPSPASSPFPDALAPAGSHGLDTDFAEPSPDASGSSAFLQLVDTSAEAVAPPVSYRSPPLFQLREAEEAAREGNLRKARRLIKVCLSHHELSPHLAQIYRGNAEINALFSSSVAHSDAKGRYSAIAKESALKAMELRPRSVDYSCYLAELLYRQANEPDDYLAVVAECKRGLSIEVPDEQITSASAGCSQRLNQLLWNSLLATVGCPDSTPSALIVAASEDAQTSPPHPAVGSSEAETRRRRLAAKNRSEKRESASITREKIVGEYWNSLSDEKKKEWLRIEVSDVVEHVKSRISWLERYLEDAMACWRSNGSWLGFSCLFCKCGGLRNPEPLKQHVLQEHVPGFASLNEPRRINNERADEIVKSSWKPLSEDTWKVPEDGFEGGGRSGHMSVGPRLSPHNWIVSADPERRQLLQEIHSLFSELIRCGCLSKTHINMFSELVMKLRPMPDNILADCRLKDFPSSVWCLGASQLSEILSLLSHIVNSCRQYSYLGNIDRSMDNTKDMLKIMEMEDQVILNDEASCFMLQEGLLLDFSCKNGWNDWILRVNYKWEEAVQIMKMLEKEGLVLQQLHGRRSELSNQKMASLMQKIQEMGTADALILQKVARIEKLAHELTAANAIDYHALLVPLLFSIVQEKLEKAAMIYATKKSDAAAEELMKEHMLVQGEGQRGNYNIRHLRKKIRKKNKKKRSRNAGDVEATGSGEGDVIHNETNQPDSSSLAQHPDSDNSVSSNNNEEEEVEWESRLMSQELGDVPNMPAIEQLRCVEDADKQKLHIGRQQKQMQSSPRSTQALTSTNSGARADVKDAHQQSINLMEGDTMNKSELYWNSLRMDEKKQLLAIEVSDFKNFFGSSSVDFIDQFITESLVFKETHGSWSFFFCCKCQKKFGDLNSHKQHIMTEHLGNHSIEMQTGMPKSLDKMVCFHFWKPLDVSMIENQLHVGDNNHVPSSMPSEDSQRKELLKKIQQKFEELIRHKCLAASHLDMVLQFIRDDLKGFSFQEYELDLICFLGATQLGNILKFLDEIVGLILDSERTYYTSLEAGSITEGVEDEKNVAAPSEGASCWLQHGKFPQSECTNSAGQETNFNVCFKKDASDAAIFSWIFTKSSAREALKSWKYNMKEKICQGEEVLKMLQELHNDLRRLCKQRLELLNTEAALVAVQHLVFEEDGAQLSRNRSNMIVLREQLRELKKIDDSMEWRCEMDAICSVLEGAETLNAHVDDKMVKLDAKILSEVSMVQQMEDKLQDLSMHDYQSTLLSLVKSFLRARLERLSKNTSAE